jgi:hypothetical protein
VDEDTPLGSSINFIFSVSSGAYGFADDFYTSVGLLVEDWESGDFSTYNWQFEGNAPWIIDDSEPYEGLYCARSGDITDGQESELFLYAEVLADGDITFFRKVSSEAEWDFLRFYIDYDMVGEWSGELNWEIVSFPVSQGMHTFRWVYEKDGYLSNGDDCAWVDYIILPPVDITTGITASEMNEHGLSFSIRPNPTSTMLHIDYTLEKAGSLEIAIYDLLGNLVAEVENESMQMKGSHTVEIDVSSLSSGIYLCRIQTTEGSMSKKLIVK